MPTLEQIFETCGKDQPYSGAIVARVVGRGDILNYKNSTGQKRQSLSLGLADHTKAVKGILYDLTMDSVCKEGSTILILNSIVKRDENVIVITKRSKVRKSCLGQTVPDNLLKEARSLVCPPDAPEVDINQIKTSPIKSLVSVKGQVTAVEIERSVKVNGQDTPVRSIRMKDATGSCKVSLWRNMAQETNEVGSYIQMTNVVVQLFNDERFLSTTSKTQIQKVEMPAFTQKAKIVAYEVKENMFALMDEANDYQEVMVNNTELCRVLQCQEYELTEKLESSLPLEAEIVTKDNEAIQIRLLDSN